jgi:hypothetical protein
MYIPLASGDSFLATRKLKYTGFPTFQTTKPYIKCFGPVVTEQRPVRVSVV